MKRILLVEDEENFGLVLKNYLELSGYMVVWCKDGCDGLRVFRDQKFHICILDVMMPKRDGFSLAEEIRVTDRNTPIMFLTAKSMKQDMIRGYKSGADDYVTKPFDTEVLLCKIEVLLKRMENQVVPAKIENVQIGKYFFHSDLRVLAYEGRETKLSPKESALLKLLCEYKNQIMPRELALKSIWKEDNYFTTRSMDVFIAKLRKRLAADSDIELINVHGNGFRLKVHC